MHVVAQNMVDVLERISALNAIDLICLGKPPPTPEKLTIYCLTKLLNRVDGDITELSTMLTNTLDNL